MVDFDTHNLDGCSLNEYCAQLDTTRTHTNKGQHHYVYITDIPSDVEALLTGSPLSADKAKVYEAFREEVRGQSHVDSSSVFWQNTKSLFDDVPFYTEERTQDGGVRTRCVTFPPLPRCIQLWNAASSVKIE